MPLCLHQAETLWMNRDFSRTSRSHAADPDFQHRSESSRHILHPHPHPRKRTSLPPVPESLGPSRLSHPLEVNPELCCAGSSGSAVTVYSCACTAATRSSVWRRAEKGGTWKRVAFFGTKQSHWDMNQWNFTIIRVSYVKDFKHGTNGNRMNIESNSVKSPMRGNWVLKRQLGCLICLHRTICKRNSRRFCLPKKTCDLGT